MLTISNQITLLLTSVIHLKSVCVTGNGLSKAHSLALSLCSKIMDPRYHKCKGKKPQVRNLLYRPYIHLVKVTYFALTPRSAVGTKNRSFQIYLILSRYVYDFSACPKLGTPFKGYKNCSKSAGRAVCTLKCHEGHSFDVDAETTFECGPDTRWRWNRRNKVTLPRCSSK